MTEQGAWLYFTVGDKNSDTAGAREVSTGVVLSNIKSAESIPDWQVTFISDTLVVLENTPAHYLCIFVKKGEST